MATTLGQMAIELSNSNPWWRESDTWASKDTDLLRARNQGFGYEADCLDDLESGCLYLLRGPRRVGKTVAVKQTIARLIAQGVPATAIVRLAADGWAAKDLRTVTQRATLPRCPQGHHRWWFIDEVTAVTGDWATQVKWLRDNDPEFIQATVVLTGSNAAGLTVASGLLAGRRGQGSRTDRTLLPLGFRTLARLAIPALPDLHLPLSGLHSPQAHEAYLDLVPWLADLARLWEIYLNYGGFPVAVAAALQGQPVPEWFINDLFHVLYKDAFAQGQLSVSDTTALVERLMNAMASPLNASKVAQDLGIATTTVLRHVQYLRDAYLVWGCPQKDDRSWTRQRATQDKLYAVDPLIARLAHLRNPARADIDLTVLAEMQIGMAINRAAHATGVSWAGDAFLFHVRTPTRKEIDFVSELLGPLAIEGKYVESGRWAGEAATVNSSGWQGVLTTRTLLDTSDQPNAWAVPAAFVAYLADT